MKRRNNALLALWVLVVAGLFVGRAIAVDIRSDFDHDCDVDAADLAHLTMCALGPSVPQTNLACADARLDADQDVDLDDFGVFQRCYSGEGNAADPTCDPPCSGPQCACLCGETNCNGTCTCLAGDSANCGSCGRVCPAGTTCVNGTCQQVSCVYPFTPCDGLCVDTGSNRNNCGGCGIRCADDEICIGGFCESGGGVQVAAPSANPSLTVSVCPHSMCSPGYTLCGGACVHLMSDPFNCGACGNQCAPSEVCSGGQCQGICVGCE